MVVSSSRSREVIANDLLVVPFVFPEIKNLNAALQSFKLGQIIPDHGFLGGKWFPLLVTVYPYFSYVYDPSGIPLSFVLLNSTDVVVRDGNLEYTNMFDAMVDAMYWALEKVGAGSVEVVICESGWPSKRTPKKPEKNVETYVFAIFNEDLKPPGVEQNFGLFYPNMSEVYHIDLN
ncbi:putative glucan endo-1,3-beta-glucosidase GVI [Tanacetum coccineum]